MHKSLILLKRLLIPPTVCTIYYALKFGAKVSTRSETELTGNFIVGKGCTVGSFTKIKASDGPLVAGKNCGIATGCFIASGENGIYIGDDFICGPNVTITSVNYKHEHINIPFSEQGLSSKGIQIGNNVWIGAGAVVLDGAKIGGNSIVVANSLVNRRYPANSIIQGNPAKVIMKRSQT